MRKIFALALIFMAIGAALTEILRPQAEESQVVRVEETPSQPTRLAFGGLQTLPERRRLNMIEIKDSKESTQDPLEVAKQYLAAHDGEVQLQAHHRLQPTLFKNPLGSKVKYSIYQGKLPIIGLDIGIGLSREMEVRSFENGYRPLNRLDVKSLYVLDTKGIVDRLPSQRYQAQVNADEMLTKVLVAIPGRDTPELAYVVSAKEVGEAKDRPVQLLVRATDGLVLKINYARSEF